MTTSSKEKGEMKHKHKWQLAATREPFMLSNGLVLKGYFMFVCECGLSKIVEQNL